jgi:pyruvate,orthophosphate dikinase
MMNTVLNLGLGDEVVEGLARQRGERFAFDCYRRLLDMFGDVVLGIDHKHFEAEIHAVKVGRGAGVNISHNAILQRGVVLTAFAAAAAPARRCACWHSSH